MAYNSYIRHEERIGHMAEEKTVSEHRITVTGILYGIVIVVLLLFLVTGTDFSDGIRSYPGEHYQLCTDGWFSEKNEPVNMHKLATEIKEVPAIRVHRRLPEEILPGEMLNISSHNLFFDVYIDGACIYRYEPVENLTGYGTGDVYHSVPLTPQDAGKEVVLDVELVHARANGGRFSDVIICSTQDFYYLIFRARGFAFLLSGLIVFLGLSILVFHFAIARENAAGYDLFSFGISVIMIGLWTMIETDVPQMLIRMTNALRVLDYTLLLFMIYPVERFIYSITKRRNPLHPKIAFAFLVVIMTIALIARFVYGIDMHRMMGLIMPYYAFSIFQIGLMLVQNRRYCRKKGIDEGLHYFYFGAVFFLGGGLIDVIRYIFMGKELSVNGNFLRIGLTIFLFTLLVQIVEMYIKKEMAVREERKKTLLMAENRILTERAELTQTLHDRLGHNINGSIYQLEASKLLLEKDPEKTRGMIQAVIDQLRSGMDEIRMILRKERPEKKKMALIHLHELCADCKAKGMEAELQTEGDLSAIPDDLWEVLLDNCYEAVSNSMKYSKAKKIELRIIVMNQMVRCVVSDNGIGCSRITDGMGISGMRQRIRAVGGTISFETEAGFLVNMLIPLKG